MLVSSTLTVRSMHPGRIRLGVPVLENLPDLAEAVRIDLSSQPDILKVSISTLTGSVLIRFPPELPASHIEHLVREALVRQLEVAVSLAAEMCGYTEPVPKKTDYSTSLKRLLESTNHHRALRTKVAALSLANGLEDAAPPLLLGLATETLTKGSASLLAKVGFKTATSRIAALGGLGIAFWLLAAFIEYQNEKAKSDLANAVRHDLRVDLYKHIQTLDISHIESKEVSDWMAIVEADVNQVHHFIKTGINPFFNVATNMVLLTGTFLLVSPAFALVQMLMLPPLVIASQKLLKPIRVGFKKARDENERMAAMLSGNIAGMSTIVSFNAQNVEEDRIEEASLRYSTSLREVEHVEAIYVPALRSVAGAGFITSIVWGGIKVTSNSLSLSTLNTMALLQLRLLSAIARLGYGLDQYQKTANALDRIYTTLDEVPSIQNGPELLPPAKKQGDIFFENVHFAYDPGYPVLDNLNLHFPAGKMIGIVGASGAGKTTVTKLLMRFYDPQSGVITFDGKRLNELNLEDLRNTMSLVSQQVTLFAGTIKENIAYGKRDSSMEDIIHAAKIAEAHEFIEALPQKYETVLGFGGYSLSGGQRQRLAIARAIVADRPVLLFDEATSALDFETEASLQRSLRSATAHRTTILIAHRLSTIRHADIIYVMKDGQVAEQGTHFELLKKNGIYAKMWNVQTGDKPTIAHSAIASLGSFFGR